MNFEDVVEDYYIVNCPEFHCVNSAKVFGLSDSIRRAKYPMATDVHAVNDCMTAGIQKLAQAPRGSGHDQMLTGVVVQFDLTFSNKAWVEFERYHFADFVSSQSTMHRIARFNLAKQYNEYVDPRIIAIMQEKVDEYNTTDDADDTKKEKYLGILYSNPAGFELTAGITTNYRQLKTIYAQRKDHRLPEWREFCRWIKTLPFSELITGENNNDQQ